MLKVNVGLSRKVSKDFQSRGFSVNLEGEVTAPLDDSESVVERISHFYHLAEEALDQEVERYQSDDQIGSRDESTNARPDNRQAANGRSSTDRKNANDSGPSEDVAATDKQINFLLTIAKRKGLSTAKLEAQITEILGRSVGLYDLSKRSAAVVIDALTGNGQREDQASRR